MANVDTENVFGFVDKRNLQNPTSNLGVLPGNLGSSTDYNDVAALRAILTSSGGSSGYFTGSLPGTNNAQGLTPPPTVLNNMTKNDMVYAARLALDSGGIT